MYGYRLSLINQDVPGASGMHIVASALHRGNQGDKIVVIPDDTCPNSLVLGWWNLE